MRLTRTKKPIGKLKRKIIAIWLSKNSKISVWKIWKIRSNSSKSSRRKISRKNIARIAVRSTAFLQTEFSRLFCECRIGQRHRKFIFRRRHNTSGRRNAACFAVGKNGGGFDFREKAGKSAWNFPAFLDQKVVVSTALDTLSLRVDRLKNRTQIRRRIGRTVIDIPNARCARTINGKIRFSIAVIIGRLRRVAVCAELEIDSSCAGWCQVIASDIEPVAIARSPNSHVGFAVAVIIARHQFVGRRTESDKAGQSVDVGISLRITEIAVIDKPVQHVIDIAWRTTPKSLMRSPSKSPVTGVSPLVPHCLAKSVLSELRSAYQKPSLGRQIAMSVLPSRS